MVRSFVSSFVVFLFSFLCHSYFIFPLLERESVCGGRGKRKASWGFSSRRFLLPFQTAQTHAHTRKPETKRRKETQWSFFLLSFLSFLSCFLTTTCVYAARMRTGLHRVLCGAFGGARRPFYLYPHTHIHTIPSTHNLTLTHSFLVHSYTSCLIHTLGTRTGRPATIQ
jgi:hypothetical protein